MKPRFMGCFSLRITQTFVNDIHGSYADLDGKNIQKQPPEVFYKKAVLNNLTIFREKKTVLEPLFNKVTSKKTCTFVKKRLQYMNFPVNFTKILKTSAHGCFLILQI